MIGKNVAHYEITDLLGKGGMGEVYRARDTKLGREVAIKILPVELSGDPERSARFEREARTLASLQHPNVASIYGFEEIDGTRFLVMELVDGEDLDSRLKHGPLPLDETMRIARQIATGLEAAHERGIVHRDLKPANIMINGAGEAKILDFGLARAWYGDDGDSNVENSPTITAAMTQAGTILGTAAYMSPEQARGREVDRRADIWAFGAILWEMVTGDRLFGGETISDTLAAVLRAEPDWEKLPVDEEPLLCRLIERCLVRDPQQRLRDIGEARILLQSDGSSSSLLAMPAASEHSDAKHPSSGGRERLVWIVVVAALIAALVATNLLRKPVSEVPLTQSTMAPPSGWDFSSGSPFAVSPEGRRIAFVGVSRPENEDAAPGTNRIFVRDLGEPEAYELADASGEAYPFWSYDGRWLVFYSGGKLNKVEARGGPIVPLCDAGAGRGGTWNEAGTIVFQQEWSKGLVKVPAAGGTPEPVTQLNKDRFDVAHRWPTFLPDGKRFLFYVVSTTNTLNSEHSGIYVGSVDSGEQKFLLQSESRALYAHDQLFYRKGSTLMAHPFDANSLEFMGDPTPIATDVPGGSISWGGGHFGVSETGLLVHMQGNISTNSLLHWRDRSGKVVSTIGEPGGYWEPCVSNDGTRMAVSVGQDAGDIWIFELERGTRTRFTFDPADDRNPIWSPDDSQIVFESSRNTSGELYIRPSSGQGDARLLHGFDTQVSPSHWSSDGRHILVTHLALTDDAWDIWVYDMETEEARPVVDGPFNQMTATLSHDGKWIAYNSNESGTDEVYVQAFPEPKGRWMISTSGGYEPIWRSDDREIFYLLETGVAAVSVVPGANFSFGTPETLFTTIIRSAQRSGYSVSKDGGQILINELPPADANRTGARLIQNWSAALVR